MKYENRNRLIFSIIFSTYLFAVSAVAQTTIFNYQGKLSDAGGPATGTYQMEFRLFDALSGGTQTGPLITNNSVVVAEGVFAVSLNFGASAFPGADRFLQISVRRNAGESFITLNPRQQIASSPYSIRTLSAALADDSAQLGGVPASQYLQTNGNGSGLTNLNASAIATGTLSNARLGEISTANIADNAVTAPKIAAGQVVKSVNALKDDITLAGGNNITITPAGNTLTIAATGSASGVTGSGTVGRVPLFSGTSAVGDSLISQSGNAIQMPARVEFAPNPQGNSVVVGTPNTELGLTMSGPSGRSDVRFNGTLKIVNGPAGLIPPDTNGLAITNTGNVGIGTITPTQKLDVFGAARVSAFGSTQISVDAIGPTNSWARYYMRTPNQSWFIGTSQNFNGDQFHLFDDKNGQFRMTVQPDGGPVTFPMGNVGIGTPSPNTRLTLNGGAPWTFNGWTASMNMQNGSALGWEANASGQRFGIGQSTGGLYFFRTTSAFGNSGSLANYDMQITDNGNLAQSEQRNGLPKAMIYADPFLPAGQYVVRCYNGVSGATGAGNGSCGGISMVRNNVGIYEITFPFSVILRFFSVTCVGANGIDISCGRKSGKNLDDFRYLK